MSPPWRVEERRGKVAELHQASASLVGSDGVEPLARRVRFLHAINVGVVIGSAQPGTDVDEGRAARAGLEIVRRRSGGGAVLVGPNEVLWIDLIIPRDDPLWQDDVGRAFWWLGDLWSGALADCGAGPRRGVARRTSAIAVVEPGLLRRPRSGGSDH